MPTITDLRPTWCPAERAHQPSLVRLWEDRHGQIVGMLRQHAAAAQRTCTDLPALSDADLHAPPVALLRSCTALNMRETMAVLRSAAASRCPDPAGLLILLAAEREARMALVVLGGDWYAQELATDDARRAEDWATISHPDELPLSVIGSLVTTSSDLHIKPEIRQQRHRRREG